MRTKAGTEKSEKVDQRLQVVYRPIATLRLDPQNPRVHSPKQIRQIADSIQAFGFNVPVLINAEGQLIAGHGRILGAQRLGMTVVPTIAIDHLNDAQIRAFMIADNRLTENATWDDQLLAEQFKVLSELDLNFNMEVTGFEVAEIDLRIESLTPAHEGSKDPADAVPQIAHVVQVSRAGDVWILDRHRMVCGNALDVSSA